MKYHRLKCILFTLCLNSSLTWSMSSDKEPAPVYSANLPNQLQEIAQLPQTTQEERDVVSQRSNDILALSLYSDLYDPAEQALILGASPNCRVEQLQGAIFNIIRPIIRQDAQESNITLFHLAVCHNALPMLKLLHKHGADVNATDKEGDTPLYYAARRSINLVRFLVEECKADIHAQDEFGRTVAIAACSKEACDPLRVVRYAHNKGVKLVENYGRTALHGAAQAGLIDVAQFLLEEAGIDPNVASHYGYSPAHYACLPSAAGSVDMLKLLAQKGADLNARSQNGSTPAHVAAEGGWLEILKYLIIERRIDNTIRDNSEQTLLLRACGKHGSRDTVEWLLEHGARIDERDKRFGTAVHCAAYGGNIDILTFLVETKGARIKVRNLVDWTPLHSACRSSSAGSLAVVKFLCGKGLSVNDVDKEKSTPLHHAAESSFADIVQFLVENKAKVNHRSLEDFTPLHNACSNKAAGSAEVIKILCENGADVTAKTRKYEHTALCFAAVFGHVDAVRYLIEHPKINVRAKTDDGFMPIHIACKKAYLPIVKLLHAKDDRLIHIAHEKLGTPLQIAVDHGNIEVADYLLDQGVVVNGLGRVVYNGLFFGHKPLGDFLEYLIHNKSKVFDKQVSKGDAVEDEVAYQERIKLTQSVLNKLIVKSELQDNFLRCFFHHYRGSIGLGLLHHPVKPIQFLLVSRLAKKREFYSSKDCVADLCKGLLPTDQSIGQLVYGYVFADLLHDELVDNLQIKITNKEKVTSEVKELWKMTRTRIQEIVKRAEHNARDAKNKPVPEEKEEKKEEKEQTQEPKGKLGRLIEKFKSPFKKG